MMVRKNPESLQHDLLQAIRSWVPPLGDLTPDAPLMKSGWFDSLALFNLVMWIEEQTGTPVDAATLDPSLEWGTVADIVRYVERRRAGS